MKKGIALTEHGAHHSNGLFGRAIDFESKEKTLANNSPTGRLHRIVLVDSGFDVGFKPPRGPTKIQDPCSGEHASK
jgi:hypothetical protein